MFDSISDNVQARLAERGVDREQIRVAARSDLDERGRFVEGWVVATPSQLHILTSDSFDSLQLDQLEDLRVDSLVTGGILSAAVKGERRRLVRFTNSHARKFGDVVRSIAALQKDEDPPATADEAQNENCPKCGLRFPDQSRKVCPRCIDRRGLFVRVLGYLQRYRRQAISIGVLMLLGSAFRALAPLLGGRVLFDDVLSPQGRFFGRLPEVVGLIIAVNAAALIAQVFYGRLNAMVSSHLVFDIKTEIFTALQRLSLGFFSKKQTGGLMARVNHDSMNLMFFFIDGLPYFIVNTVMIAAVVCAMLALNWSLTLLLLIPAPLIVVLVNRFFPRLWRLFSQQFRSLAAMNSVVNDSLTGVRVVKAFGKEDEEMDRFRPVSQDVYRSHLNTERLFSTLFPTVWFLTQAGGLVVWAAGGWQVVNGALTFGILMSFVGYLTLLYEPLRFMTMVVEWWSMAMNSAQRIFEILDSVPDVVEQRNPTRLPQMRGRVDLQNVTFAYEPNLPVLHAVSFTIEAGSMIGLVGHTGAGKSTLINLITRLYDVDEGSVSIDGIDVRQLAVEDLRRQIGIILQEPYLFAGTVAENIAYGRPEASWSQIVTAAKAAYAHDFITQLTNGYDTLLGTKGQDLSGGQRQRLSIARAVLIDPRILILDEATSSMDSETEQMIQEALDKLIEGRTTIGIAHRLSTLRRAQRLVVVEKGRIVEEGTHRELMAARGVYQRLVQKQRDALKVIGLGEER